MQAAEAVLASGRRLDAVVGPAGTGKTTTMSAVKNLWETQFGPGPLWGWPLQRPLPMSWATSSDWTRTT
ncbi:AAA family ATPase [Arthrobacter psychrolactophilus]